MCSYEAWNSLPIILLFCKSSFLAKNQGICQSQDLSKERRTFWYDSVGSCNNLNFQNQDNGGNNVVGQLD
ncbi:hypothetical protein [Candidatus Nitrosocosmicus sp. R]